MDAEATPVDRTELVIEPASPWSARELGDLWEYRELFWILALRDVSVRYKQAVLGVLWALIQPGAQIVIFTILFNRLAGIHADIDVPYPVFCLSGLVVWQLFASGLNNASDSLIGNSNLITKVFFPRVIIPVASILAATVDFAIGLVLLAIVMIVFHAHVHASAVLTLPLALLAAFNAAAFGLWTSAINLQFRDVRYALPFVMQLLVYLTPVFYPTSLIPARWRFVTALNPMAPIVESFRAALFGQPLPLGRLAISVAITFTVGALGWMFFRATERTFADRV